jgi:anti-sigma-K factor RskA
MSDEHTISPDDDPTLAAEYVLGVLSAAERHAAELRAAQEPTFAREIAFWEARLGHLASDVAPVAPSATVWRGIETALRPADAPQERSIWDSLAFWRSFAVGTAAVAMACLAALFYIEVGPVQRAPLVATLDAAGGSAGFFAAVTTDGQIMVIPASVTRPDGRAWQLWLIPPGDRPHSLGLLPGSQPVRITVPDNLRRQVARDAVLAVSVEPPSGSPTGLPTGPVIANGKLTSL